MKYFIVESVMKNPLPATPQQMKEVFVPAHEKHLHEGIAAGMLLMGGPSATGGFLVLRAEEQAAIEAFLNSDPFHTGGLNEFVIKEFDPRDRADMVKDW